jgi:hypothetical protein
MPLFIPNAPHQLPVTATGAGEAHSALGAGLGVLMPVIPTGGGPHSALPFALGQLPQPLESIAAVKPSGTATHHTGQQTRVFDSQRRWPTTLCPCPHARIAPSVLQGCGLVCCIYTLGDMLCWKTDRQSCSADAKTARAACALRCKQKKRNNGGQACKIRYEMRKINAAQRPRFKVRLRPLSSCFVHCCASVLTGPCVHNGIIVLHHGVVHCPPACVCCVPPHPVLLAPTCSGAFASAVAM